MVAAWESCVDHFVCNWRGAAHPQPAHVFKAIHACGKVVRIILFANGGCCASPTSPAFLKPSMLMVQFMVYAICMVAIGEGCACLRKGDCCAPPNPLALRKSSMLRAEKDHVIALFAVRERKAGLCGLLFFHHYPWLAYHAIIIIIVILNNNACSHLIITLMITL